MCVCVCVGSVRSAYLHKGARARTAARLWCPGAGEDAEHAIFRCSRYTGNRVELTAILGSDLEPEDKNPVRRQRNGGRTKRDFKKKRRTRDEEIFHRDGHGNRIKKRTRGRGNVKTETQR